jgi:hypothetical protein
MMNIAFMSHKDDVRVDPDRLEALHLQLGAVGAENVIARAMAELSSRFIQLRAANDQIDRDIIYKLARGISAIADQVGMVTLSRVARDVSVCAYSDDRAAFEATLARLCRIGDYSLNLVWELSGQTI